MNTTFVTTTVQSFSESFAKLVRSFQFKLKVILSVTALATIAIVFFLGVQKRQHTLEDHQALSVSAMAKIQSTQVELIADTRHFLEALAKVPAVLDPTSPACGAFLAQTLLLTPQYVNLGVPSADGELRCNATPLPGPVNVGDRPYIKYALDNKAFSIGTYQFDRAAQMTSLNFAYPVAPDGDASGPIGAVVAVVSLDWWSAYLEVENLPEGTVAFIFDRDNQIVAAYPPRADLLGENITESGFDLKIFDEGVTEAISDSYGVHRVFTHKTLFHGLNGNWVSMSLGVPVDAAIAVANRQMVIQMIVLSGIWMFVWLLTIKQMEWIVFRPVRVMINTLERLERGDDDLEKGSDTKGPPAVQEVTQSFRKMTKESFQAEKNRKAQADQMAALIGALPDTYFRIDQDGLVLECRISQLSDMIAPPEELQGRKVSEILPANALAKFNQNLAKHREAGELVTWEYELDLEDGVRVFEARLCGISGTDEMIAVVRNITARRVAEQDRENAEIRLNRIIENLPGVTISMNMVDPKKPMLTFLSPQAEDIWGYTADEIYADDSLIALAHDPDDIENMLGKLAHSAETLMPFQHRYKIITRTGEHKWLQTNTGSSRHSNGEVHTDGFVVDVTKEVETQTQLERQRELTHQAQKHESIGLLTGGVAHDFNNLLAIIMGNLELLSDDLSDDDQLGLIKAGLDATKRGADLTRSMLAFARKARLEPEVIQLNKLVSETQSWSGRTMPANISIETSLLAGLWDIEADISSTESALLNLILNARDAMPTGGNLTIETENVRIDQAYADSRGEVLETGRYVMLAVSDTGSGMSQDTLVKIFEPFYSTKPPGAGSGLGLSMIEGFMHQSGGSVQVYTELNVGSTFKLYFRASGADRRIVKTTPTTVNAPQSTGQRILVAEDEQKVLSVIVAILEKAGYDVTPASTGDEARVIFEADSGFDLLLTDIVMPGTLQGTTLSKALRERSPKLPVVFMSGYANEATVHGNGLRPEDIRLMKPVARADLLAAIIKALEKKESVVR